MSDTLASGRQADFTNSRLFKWATIAATVFALIGFPLVFAPVQDFLFGKRTGLKLERLSEIPLVDVNRSLGGLKVEFQGKDLTALRQGVIASQIQITNIGNESITPAKMTPVDPLGFEVQGGTIARMNLVAASSDHLRHFASPAKKGERITLSPEVIIDPGDYVRFDLIILRPLNGKLTYRAIGKVEGVKSIEFQDALSHSGQAGFFDRAFGGNGLVQFARLVFYVLAALTLVILFLFAGTRVDARNRVLNKRKRYKLASEVLTQIGSGKNGVHAMAADIYKMNGLVMLRQMEERVRKPFPPELPDAKGVPRRRSMEVTENFEISVNGFLGLAYDDAARALATRLRDAGLINLKSWMPKKEVELGFIAFREELERRASVDGIKLSDLETSDLLVMGTADVGIEEPESEQPTPEEAD